MNATITYVGPLEDGTVQCPQTGKHYAFKRGSAISVPEEIASALISQSPNHWSGAPSLKKISEPIKPAEPNHDEG